MVCVTHDAFRDRAGQCDGARRRPSDFGGAKAALSRPIIIPLRHRYGEWISGQVLWSNLHEIFRSNKGSELERHAIHANFPDKTM